MTDKTDRRAVEIGKLMAATSALALSLGMMAQADAASTQDKHVPGQTTTQIKGESTQLKWINTHKHDTVQHKTSTQIKGESSQHKHIVPSNQLNPQPEPPMQTGNGPTPH